MIGAFIFNDMIDIDYVYMDLKCKKELINMAFNKGLVDDVKSEDDIDPNILLQLFTPLISTYFLLHQQFATSYREIKIKNQFKFTFRKFSNQLYMLVDDYLTLSNALHYLTTVNDLLSLLYGPNVEMVKKYDSRKERWEYLSSILNKWIHLYEHSISCRLQSLETLATDRILARTLKQRLSQLTSTKTQCFCCVTLNNCLICDHSSASMIHIPVKIRILLNIISFSLLTNRYINQSSFSFASNRNQSTFDGQSYTNQLGDFSLTSFASMSCAVGVGDGGVGVGVAGPPGSRCNVFLKSADCAGVYTIHELTAARLDNDVLVTTLNEVPNTTYTGDICRSIQELDADRTDFLNLKECNKRYTKLKSTIPSCLKENICINNLLNKITSILSLALKSMATHSNDVNSITTLASRTRGYLRQLYHACCQLHSNQANFRKSTRCRRGNLRPAAILDSVLFSIRQAMLPYSAFLSVKSEVHPSIDRYTASFPHLIYFVYVDRSVPCVYHSSFGQLSHKHTVMNGLNRIMHFLARGYTSVNIKSHHFVFTYNRWCLKCRRQSKDSRIACPCTNCYYRDCIQKNKEGVTYVELISVHSAPYANKTRAGCLEDSVRLVQLLVDETMRL